MQYAFLYNMVHFLSYGLTDSVKVVSHVQNKRHKLS